MKTSIIIFSVLFAIECYSQVPEILWQQCYGTSDTDYNFAISSTINGYIIALEVRTGEGLTNYHGLYEIWVVATDTTGELIWERCYGGTNHDAPRKIVKANDDIFYILGGTSSADGDVQSYNHGYADLWVIKINSQGDLLWEKCYGSPGTDEPRDMILTPDGGFVMLARISYAGGDISQYYGSYDNWICKCDSLGNIEWEKTLGNDGLDNCVSMIINSENNIMMIGAAQKHGGLVECYPDEVWGDVWLVELDLQGNIVSQHCYGGSDYDLGYSIFELNEGYIFTASVTSNDGDVSGLHGPPGGPPNGWDDIWVVRLNEQMDIIWQKCLGGFNGDSPNYITKIENNNIIVFGTTWSHDGDVSGNHSYQGAYDTDIWAVKLDQDGEIEWQQCYGGWGSERLENPHTILKKDDYNYVIASSSDYSPSYDVQCGAISGVERDAWIFEIDIEDTTEIAELYIEPFNITATPNPAKTWVTFDYELPVYISEAVLQVTDMKGNMIIAFTLTTKEGQQVWDIRNIEKGVYLYTLKVGTLSKSGKLIVE